MLKLLFLLFTIPASYGNAPIVADGSRVYTSPNGTVSIEILVESTKDSKPGSYMGRGTLRPGTKIPTHIHKDSDLKSILK